MKQKGLIINMFWFLIYAIIAGLKIYSTFIYQVNYVLAISLCAFCSVLLYFTTIYTKHRKQEKRLVWYLPNILAGFYLFKLDLCNYIEFDEIYNLKYLIYLFFIVVFYIAYFREIYITYQYQNKKR